MELQMSAAHDWERREATEERLHAFRVRVRVDILNNLQWWVKWVTKIARKSPFSGALELSEISIPYPCDFKLFQYLVRDITNACTSTAELVAVTFSPLLVDVEYPSRHLEEAHATFSMSGAMFNWLGVSNGSDKRSLLRRDCTSQPRPEKKLLVLGRV